MRFPASIRRSLSETVGGNAEMLSPLHAARCGSPVQPQPDKTQMYDFLIGVKFKEMRKYEWVVNLRRKILHTVQGLRVNPQFTHESSPSELFVVSLIGPWDR